MNRVTNSFGKIFQRRLEVFSRKRYFSVGTSEQSISQILQQMQSGSITAETAENHEVAKIISVKASALEGQSNEMKKIGKVAVTCAGTTDLPVAEEAAITLEAAGCEVDRIYDVGVAGLHRIINALPRLKDPSVDCVICIAGMHHFEFVKYLFGIDNISNHFLKAWKGRCRQC
jgi:NCAIR mutase (PurE)-related protein